MWQTHSEQIYWYVHNSSSNSGGTAAKAQFVPVKRGKKRLKKDPVVEAIKTIKNVTEKDSTKELLKSFKEKTKGPGDM